MTTLRRPEELAADLEVDARHVMPWGPQTAKVHLDALRPRGAARYVLVTAMTPDRAGVGKTTVSLGLGDALRARGKRAAVAIRQSSLGPSFGAKGGGGGGGAARIEPLWRSLLHLTGDMHAVTTAHNLIAALLDNAWHHGAIDLSTADVQWNRVIDINDRALRSIEVGFKDKHRKSHFELTAASELMAILALVDGADAASVVADLRRRIGRIVLATTEDAAITAEEVGAAGVASALLVDAVHPNLMQSAAGTPVLIHAGPFANIAHGCSSIVADRVALGGAEVVITEAGFGAEVGAEKFFDIKCRTSGVLPDTVVLVATVGAVDAHGDRGQGLANLAAQIANVRQFGIRPIVAINRHDSDSASDYAAIEQTATDAGAATCVVCDAFVRGSDGALALADAVLASTPQVARLLYPDGLTATESLTAIAQRMYGAAAVQLSARATERLDQFAKLGADRLPVCVAKTAYSLGGDPALRGAPTGHTLEVSDVRLSAGAGFIYALTENTLTMPGMGATPRALGIDVGPDGSIFGLA